MSAVINENKVDLDPATHFKNFEENGGVRVDAVLMNLFFLIQTDGHKKWTKEEFFEFMEPLWDHIDKIPKVSKYR